MTLRLGVDWGSTYRRAYLATIRGELVDEIEDRQGVLNPPADFARSLQELVARWADEGHVDTILLSGMIGSRSGWVEVPYASVPAAFEFLKSSLHRVANDGATVRIVCGVCDRDAPEVMRGEETQVLGASLLGAGDGCYLLPGTHSKWVHVERQRIVRLRTYLTGELFDLISRHGSLSTLLRDGISMRGFEEGLRVARTSDALTSALFSLRAGVLLDRVRAEDAGGWLSGLLIGAEWVDARRRGAWTDTGVNLIAAGELAHFYRKAADVFGASIKVFAPRASFLAAMNFLLEDPQGAA